MKFIIRELAIQDTVRIVEWYQAIQPSLANRFLEELDHLYDLIEKYPLSGRTYKKHLREIGMSRFPFVILYEYDDSIGKALIVHGLFHYNMRQSKKRKRA